MTRQRDSTSGAKGKQDCHAATRRSYALRERKSPSSSSVKTVHQQTRYDLRQTQSRLSWANGKAVWSYSEDHWWEDDEADEDAGAAQAATHTSKKPKAAARTQGTSAPKPSTSAGAKVKSQGKKKSGAKKADKKTGNQGRKGPQKKNGTKNVSKMARKRVLMPGGSKTKCKDAKSGGSSLKSGACSTEKGASSKASKKATTKASRSTANTAPRKAPIKSSKKTSEKAAEKTVDKSPRQPHSGDAKPSTKTLIVAQNSSHHKLHNSHLRRRTSSNTFDFLDLPPELRMMVYEFYFPDGGFCPETQPQCRFAKSGFRRLVVTDKGFYLMTILPFAQVNRQLRAETWKYHLQRPWSFIVVGVHDYNIRPFFDFCKWYHGQTRMKLPERRVLLTLTRSSTPVSKNLEWWIQKHWDDSFPMFDCDNIALLHGCVDVSREHHNWIGDCFRERWRTIKKLIFVSRTQRDTELWRQLVSHVKNYAHTSKKIKAGTQLGDVDDERFRQIVVRAHAHLIDAHVPCAGSNCEYPSDNRGPVLPPVANYGKMGWHELNMTTNIMLYGRMNDEVKPSGLITIDSDLDDAPARSGRPGLLYLKGTWGEKEYQGYLQ